MPICIHCDRIVGSAHFVRDYLCPDCEEDSKQFIQMLSESAAEREAAQQEDDDDTGTDQYMWEEYRKNNEH